MKRYLLLICLSILSILSIHIPVQADDNRPVLLVYDSENIYYNGSKKIDSVQRMLTADGLKIKTVMLENYRSGELSDNKYRGVVTLINWQEADLSNDSFTHDRAKFSGTKLHIGPNLQDDELEGLHAKKGMIIRQQLTLSDDGITEQIPYTNRMEYLVDVAGSDKYGVLNTQNVGNQKTLPYGVKVDSNAFLPFWNTSGLAVNCEEKLIADLFNTKTDSRPLLVINNVTPTSNLEYLDKLVDDLYRNNIPFAVSATNVEGNTNQFAYKKYMYSLRMIELKNGIIFMRVPYLYSYTGKEINAQNLKATMSERLQLMVRSGVYPTGLSTPNHWNQDAVLGKVGLKSASNVLLLPDPKTYPKVEQTDYSQEFDKAYYVMSLKDLDKAKTTVSLTKANNLNYTLPTALNIKMPRTLSELRKVEKSVSKSELNWENPAAEDNSREMNFAKMKLEYHAGTYFVKGKFLTVFILVTLIGFVLLIYKGRKVYWDKFKRK
ncbi:hypothetical protein [Ligilactobacillus salivarius]|uniref:hypothetical protein n=1 Tax=Ligilactobacillus salivarius TaxID=1624 RepID=UPI001F505116|nr:hypothetical protein [Ligilactobacillus salivarius]